MLTKIIKRAFPQTPKGNLHPSPVEAFHSDNYLRHTARRLEHLASLHIPVAGKSVLDVASGIGDHAQYYFDRGCRVTLSDGRPENLEVLRRRFPGAPVYLLDMEKPEELPGSPFEIVHCYGLLYHLGNPDVALDYLAKACSEILFLETCVTPGDHEEIHPVEEDPGNPTWAVSGKGCRPTRPWIFKRLQKHFAHVYVTTTQPNHPHFPVEWKNLQINDKVLTRAVFVAAHKPLECPWLVNFIPHHQTRHP